jgi:hypothetical protein
MTRKVCRFLSAPEANSARFSLIEPYPPRTHLSELNICGAARYNENTGGAGENRTRE